MTPKPYHHSKEKHFGVLVAKFPQERAPHADALNTSFLEMEQETSKTAGKTHLPSHRLRVISSRRGYSHSMALLKKHSHLIGTMENDKGWKKGEESIEKEPAPPCVGHKKRACTDSAMSDGADEFGCPLLKRAHNLECAAIAMELEASAGPWGADI